MSNKKGISTVMAVIVVGIPLLVLLGILLFNMMKGAGIASPVYDQMVLSSRNASCKYQGTILKNPFDNDFGRDKGDSYPDSCDICLGGNNEKDSDGDGMPDACDNDPNNPPEKGMSLEKMCESSGKGSWKNDQCMLKCYTNYLTGRSPSPCPLK